ncbi:MAG: DNA polymerase I [Bacteroidia bacterium]|nr:DNA polymerase I [Bacteroidia bacterium]
MAKNKVFLLDAMALLYRAHFAFIKNPRITSNGLNTSAIFGFTNTLLEIINKEEPTHLAVAFDVGSNTFRHKDFPEYKANREEMPEDLRKAIPYAKKLLEVLKIPALGIEEYEADDIIGTISHHIDPEEFEVYMVTPDKDYAQLVKENVFLYKPKYRGGGFDVLGAAEVEESMGIPPSQVIDFLGLKGDSVDNIPGIPKIGDKTAISLLKEYGSVETIIEQAEHIKKKSIRESIIANKEQGLLSKKLATIHLDVPIDWSPEMLKLEHCDLEELLILVKELEFKTTAQRILNSKLNPARPDQQRDLFGNAVGEGATFDIPSDSSNFESTEQKYELFSDKAARTAFIKRAKEAGLLCFDTETTSLDALQAELVGASFSIKAGEAYFLHFPVEMAREEVIEILKEFEEVFHDKSIVKIGQNLKYDLLVLKTYGIEVEGPFFDTMLAHYIIEPGGKHGMDAMSEQLLNYKPISIESLIGKKGKKQKSMRDVEIEPLVKYACEDADITLRLYEKLHSGVKDIKVFEEIEQPLMPVLTAMETEGVRLDTEFLGEYSVELEKRMEILENEIYELAGEKFNIKSPKQLGTILFDKLELGKGKKQKKTKTGQYVTNEQELTNLSYANELPAKVLAYRGVTKLKSTYVDALPKMINPNTGHIHTSFRQSVAVTGRLSSDNPNLQNIPIKTSDGREVRKAFIPRNEDFVLLSADYSQVELRLMAAMSGDEAMIAAFQNKEDIHRATAAKVFGLAPEEITTQQRSYAKQVNFGIIYGISAFGLSQRIGISRSEAKEIIENYFSQYAGVKAYMDKAVEDAKIKGYVETLFGRKRYLADINSKNATVRGFAERNAINSPIQGTAADIVKIAMISIQDAMLAEQMKSKMILQVHDELVFDVHKSEVDQVKEMVRKYMMGAADLSVPLEVEMGTGMNWLEAH